MNKISLQSKLTLLLILVVFPVIALAGNSTPTTFEGLVDVILELINIIIPAIFGVLFVVIMWKIIKAWVINGGDQASRDEGKQLVPVAVIVFVLMLVTWGIIALLRNTFFGT